MLPDNGQVTMSPGSAGATTTWASGPVAVNVFMKNDSRRAPTAVGPSAPPFVLVSISTAGDMAIIAPASADGLAVIQVKGRHGEGGAEADLWCACAHGTGGHSPVTAGRRPAPGGGVAHRSGTVPPCPA